MCNCRYMWHEGQHSKANLVANCLPYWLQTNYTLWSWKNSKGQQRMPKWHFLYIVNKRVSHSLTWFCSSFSLYSTESTSLNLKNLKLPELVMMKIFLGIPANKTIPEPSLPYPFHWVLSASLQPTSHADCIIETQHHHNYTEIAS